jgi:hypothetical protein
MPTFYPIQIAVRILDTTFFDFQVAAIETGLTGHKIDGTRVWTQTELDRIREELESVQS